MSVSTKFSNINFLTKTQYDEITTPSTNELWAIETPVVIESYIGAGHGYLLYSNHTLIQWGKEYVNASPSTITFSTNLLKNFSTADYSITFGSGYINLEPVISVQQTTAFSVTLTNADIGGILHWTAIGEG